MQEDLAIANTPIASNPGSLGDRDLLVPRPITQSHLSNWQTCPRKYQHTYIDSLGTPISSEQEEKMQLGQKFHLLMQQHDLGLDVEKLAANPQTPNLQKWLEMFKQSPPKMINGDRHSEHRRTLGMFIDAVTTQGQPYRQMYTLTVVYDLLIFGTGVAQIVDWKTHQKSIAKAKLKESWQTRLYLYLLAETTAYTADQLKMTYWFANNSKTTTLGYDRAEHERTQADLTRILEAINDAKQTDQFPQIKLGSKACEQCDFAYRCDRVPSESMAEIDPALDPEQASSIPTDLIKHPEQLADRLEQIPEIEI